MDFETTGVDPLVCRPVSVAFVLFDSANAVEPRSFFNRVIDCGVEVPEGAANVHGLTTERVRLEGCDPKHALGAIAFALDTCAEEGVPVVIMNARFDWTLLTAEAERHGLPAPPDVCLIDPLIIDQKFDKYRRGGRKLADLCRTYGLPPLDDAHDAMADARAAIGVTRAMARKYLSTVPLRDMAMLQTEWFETFRVSRNSYWKSVGDERFMEPGWPLLDRREP